MSRYVKLNTHVIRIDHAMSANVGSQKGTCMCRMLLMHVYWGLSAYTVYLC